MTARQASPGQIWNSFSYEVNRSTALLMFLLQGMESLRNSATLPVVRIHEKGSVTEFKGGFPNLSLFSISPIFSGIDFNSLLEREGEAEQLAFKGWVEQVYNIVWESRHRNSLEATLDEDDAIRPQLAVLGDLRLIRNDLIHSGIATEGETGRCKVLIWFDPSEPIILGMRHVFDFLNQMGWMVSSPSISEDYKVFNWDLSVAKDKVSISDQGRPKIISVRTIIDSDSDNGDIQYMISIVFEDGFFAQSMVDMSPISRPGDSDQDKSEIFNGATIDRDGNLQFSTRTISSSELYDWWIGAERVRGKGMPGPWIKFREG